MSVAYVPGRASRCARCGDPIVWVRTLAGPTSAGGKAMPLNRTRNDNGNVAVRATGPGSAVARVLRKGETPDRTCEVLAMPHAATCHPTLVDPPRPIPDGVADLAAHRARRRP